MGQLVIDQGNSYCKVGRFDGSDYRRLVLEGELTIEQLDDACKRLGVTSDDDGIYCSVGAENKGELINALQQKVQQFVLMTERTKLPLTQIDYNRHTIGNDRIAAVVGAIDYCSATNHNALIVDAGTAITYEFLRHGTEYLGGTISPGITLRFRSLNQQTKRLPQVESHQRFKVIGNCTEEAIRSGVLSGIAFEIEGYIRYAREEVYKEEPFTVLLTGGYAEDLSNLLKSRTFVCPTLVETGLKKILEYNVNEQI